MLVHRAPGSADSFAPERNEGGFQHRGPSTMNEVPVASGPRRIEIGEEPAPRNPPYAALLFAAHVLDGEQHLLPVAAHARLPPAPRCFVALRQDGS